MEYGRCWKVIVLSVIKRVVGKVKFTFVSAVFSFVVFVG